MQEEAQLLGLDVEIMFAEDFQLLTDLDHQILYQYEKIDLPQAAFIRSYDLSLVKHLEEMGVKTFNSYHGLQTSRDKWASHLALARQGLSSPKTLLLTPSFSFEWICKEVGLPFILKDAYGTHGDQVHLIENKETYLKIISHCQKGLAQRYVKTSHGRDLRVHVIGGQVVASVLRYSDKSFLSNYSQGGKAKAYSIDDRAKTLAIQATEALGLDFSGVDLLFDGKDYTVCEVNGIPGFRTIGLTSQENIPHMMLKYIKETL